MLPGGGYALTGLHNHLYIRWIPFPQARLSKAQTDDHLYRSASPGVLIIRFSHGTISAITTVTPRVTRPILLNTLV